MLLLFVLLATLCRFSSFFASANGWNEGLYILLADQWLHGYAPYTAVWDNKPPGIYALFAAAIFVVGRSVIVVRALACLAVAATAYTLFHIGAKLKRDGRGIGLIAGCFYTGLSLNNGGISANTEVFFLAPSVAAHYFVLSATESESSKTTIRRLAYAAIFYGLAFEIKYVVLFDFLAGLGVLALRLLRCGSLRQSVVNFLKCAGILFLGAVVPFLSVTALFWASGHLTEYWAANVTANRARTIQQPFRLSVMLGALNASLRSGYAFWLGIPLGLLFLLVRGRLTRDDDRWIVLAGVSVCWATWAACCWFSIAGSTITTSYSWHLGLRCSPPS